MYIHNKFINLIYKAIIVILSFYGLYLDLGVWQGEIRWYMFNYFTILSNLFCLIYFLPAFVINLALAAQKKPLITFAPRIKGVVVLSITVTMLVYHILLAPFNFSMSDSSSIDSIANVILHTLVPLMTIFDWILFDKKGSYKKYDPLLWTIPALLYFAYINIRTDYAGVIHGTDSQYPYKFIDVYLLGWGEVIRNVIELVIIFIIIGYIYYLIDSKMKPKPVPNKKNRKRK